MITDGAHNIVASVNQLGIRHNQATIELTEEKRVGGSKAIPLIKMLKHFIAGQCGQMPHGIGAKLATNLNKN